ncbi:ComEB Deoxycytidylate deaminase [uncultured Caudovirales phage]|uniref:ComEB Deoxycytidylate deaminase n=1 Tax=uncultured Caudovirales phage TaxID=2100421 RepID=A0A6J5KST8_9CAUD|nr:ComEB Deoxycytidylate deaminase [uncultured Caudovirales phage]
MKAKFVKLYFDLAIRISELSYGERLKVGAVIVKDHRILSYGYNGTPAGFDNCCEDKVYCNDETMLPEEIIINFPYRESSYSHNDSRYKLVSKPEVLHAELNAIAKIAKHGDSCEGSSLFVTHSPCIECSKIILQSGITSVYYKEAYRLDDGIRLLRKGNVNVYECDQYSLS